jgi:TonB family protein
VLRRVTVHTASEKIEMLTPRTSFTAVLRFALLACACLFATVVRAQESKQAQASSAQTSSDAARGIELFKRGDTDAAIKALRDATKKDKTDADAWYYLGLALVKQHNPKDARRAFETAAHLRPNFVAALDGLAYALIEQGNLKQAKGVAESSLKIEPDNSETHYILGAIYLRSNAFAKALDEAEESAKINPSYAHAYFLKGEALVGIGSDELNNASDEKGNAREALLKRVNARIEEATAALDNFSKLIPQSPFAAALAERIKTLHIYAEIHGAPVSERTVFSAKEVTTTAIVTARPEPLYTEEARRNQVTGTVTIRMVLAADGTVKYIFAVTRLPDGLTESAIRAARGIKFIPATKDGRPVSEYATIQYNFNIY